MPSFPSPCFCTFILLSSCLFKKIKKLPRQVFSEVEAKLIQLWGEHVKKKSGTMMKRSVKEKEVAEALTAYSRQLGDTESVYTASVIHSKIDNLKTNVANYDSCIGPVPERYTTKHGQVWSTTTFTYKEEWSVERARLITVRSKQEEA